LAEVDYPKVPAFLFSDSKDKNLYHQVMNALESLGLKPKEIPKAETLRKFRLWRIVKSNEPVMHSNA
jgi:hypothetical protein